jgi:metal-sulfur cluster biosynthetic enzyme
MPVFATEDHVRPDAPSGLASAVRELLVLYDKLTFRVRFPSTPLFLGDAMPAVTEDEVRSALKQCYDPEIPVNIVDLGLIYAVRLEPVADDRQDVSVDLTLTSPGCPSHVMIGEQVKARLEQLPGIRTATVNVVWTPPWTPERLSPEARTQLGIE